MKFWNRLLLPVLCLSALYAFPGQAQTAPPQKPQQKAAATSPEADAQKKNTQAYIDLLRRDVRQEKSEIMGAMMVLNAQDAEKFWPIYSAYDAELSALNDQRVQNIKEYARTYDQMTDEQADKLVQSALSFRKQRTELFASTYEKVKQALGGIVAARFAQVEDQLLLLIDLQIESSLPVMAQGS